MRPTKREVDDALRSVSERRNPTWADTPESVLAAEVQAVRDALDKFKACWFSPVSTSGARDLAVGGLLEDLDDDFENHL